MFWKKQFYQRWRPLWFINPNSSSNHFQDRWQTIFRKWVCVSGGSESRQELLCNSLLCRLVNDHKKLWKNPLPGLLSVLIMKICAALICWRSFFYPRVCKRQSIPTAGKTSEAGNVLEITQMPELLQGKEQTYLLNSRIKGSTKGLEQEQWLSIVGVAEEWWRECLPPPSCLLSCNNCQNEPLLLIETDQVKSSRKIEWE